MRSREEHNTQVACVKWFKLQYPKFARLIYSIPNGGTRDKREAKTLKAEGLLAGASDVVIAIPNTQNHGLYIEFKSSVGTQSKDQMEFQRAVESMGYRYVIVRRFETFVGLVREQLNHR